MRLLPLASLTLALAGCGGSTPRARGPLAYSTNAERLYREAKSNLNDGNCLEAVPAFQRVRRVYPYSRFAALAELRVADCDLHDEKFPDAIRGYREFLRAHPTHSEAHYAAFRVAYAFWRQVPGDWALVPPAHERDETPAREALRELRAFLDAYPASRYAPRARRLAARSEDLLGRHELYVADFYLRRGRYAGAAGRLRGVLRDYPGTPLEPRAMLLLARVQMQTRRPGEAVATLRDLLARFPRSPQAEPARRYLREFAPPSAASPPTSARSDSR